MANDDTDVARQLGDHGARIHNLETNFDRHCRNQREDTNRLYKKLDTMETAIGADLTTIKTDVAKLNPNNGRKRRIVVEGGKITGIAGAIYAIAELVKYWWHA